MLQLPGVSLLSLTVNWGKRISSGTLCGPILGQTQSPGASEVTLSLIINNVIYLQSLWQQPNDCIPPALVLHLYLILPIPFMPII